MRAALAWMAALVLVALLGAALWTLRGTNERPAGPAFATPADAAANAGDAQLRAIEPERTASAPAERRVVEDPPTADGADTLRIRGRVLDGEEPVDEFVVVVFDLEAPRALDKQQIEGSSDGCFEIAVPGPGTWGVSAMARQRGCPMQEVSVPQGEAELVLTLDALASLRVRVVDSQGVPLPGARVHAKGRGFEETLVTDALGRVQRDELTPGSYEVMAELPGWARSQLCEAIVSARVPDHETTLELRAPARVFGRVVDVEGAPEVDVEVKCHARSPGGDERLRTSTQSDAEGRFEFVGLPPDRYIVGVEDDMRDDRAEGQAAATRRIELVELAEGQEVELLLGARSSQRIPVRGRVLAGGLPAEGGSMVTLADGRRVMDDPNEIDLAQGGRFAFELSAPGRFVFLLEYQKGTYPFRVDVPPGGLDDLVLELPVGQIFGSVLRPQEAGDGKLTVRLERQDAQGVIELGQGALETQADAAGAFAFENLAPGTYALGAADEQSRRSRLVGGLVLTAGGAVGPVELRLETIGTVDVRVLDGEGRPLAGAAVFARQVDGSFYQAVGDKTRSNRPAKFWLPAGRYTFLARTLRDASPESEPVDVEAEGFERLDLTLGPGTQLSVALQEADGTPLTGRLVVRDATGRTLSGLMAGHDIERLLLEGFSTLAPEVGPLPPGTYTVTISAADGRRAEREVTLAGEPRHDLVLRL